MAVEWDTLLFFAALFVVVEGVSEMGLLRFIANTLSVLIFPLPATYCCRCCSYCCRCCMPCCKQ
jgi:Na+/H+ antiporter NhaD/arsenite permease-like protein